MRAGVLCSRLAGKNRQSKAKITFRIKSRPYALRVVQAKYVLFFSSNRSVFMIGLVRLRRNTTGGSSKCFKCTGRIDSQITLLRAMLTLPLE